MTESAALATARRARRVADRAAVAADHAPLAQRDALAAVAHETGAAALAAEEAWLLSRHR